MFARTERRSLTFTFEESIKTILDLVTSCTCDRLKQSIGRPAVKECWLDINLLNKQTLLINSKILYYADSPRTNIALASRAKAQFHDWLQTNGVSRVH